MLKNMLKNSFKFPMNFFSSLKRKENVVVFESFNGRQFSDNPRAIFEELKKTKPHYKLYWSVDRNHVKNFENKDINIIIKYSPKWFEVFFTCKYWVSNSRFPQWIKKPKNTTYIQTWHGTPLKKLALDMTDIHMVSSDLNTYKEDFKKESSQWDYLISPNNYSTEIFKRAFAYNKEVLEYGYPRNDFLINENSPESISFLKEKLNIPKNKKVILYAPTWRDNNHENGKYDFDIKLDLKEMKERLGEEYVVILRLHYLISKNIDLTGLEDFAYDFSNFEDIRYLYLISDLLITDYSSVFFDYSLLKKPILFYTYDIDEYKDVLRGFYFDFENNAPGPLFKNSDLLIDYIENTDFEKFKLTDRYLSFCEKFGSLENGNSSKKIIDKVFK